MDKPKIAYVAGKYRGHDDEEQAENITLAGEVAKILWGNGYVVICPHMNSAWMDDAADDEAFLQGYLRLVEVSDVLFMLPNWRESEGARGEFAHAGKCGKDIITLGSIEDAYNFRP